MNNYHKLALGSILVFIMVFGSFVAGEHTGRKNYETILNNSSNPSAANTEDKDQKLPKISVVNDNDSSFTLKTREISYPPEPGKKIFLERRNILKDIKISETALILIDTWDTEIDPRISDNYASLSARIMKDIFPPMLKAVRNKGMLIIHSPNFQSDENGNNIEAERWESNEIPIINSLVFGSKLPPQYLRPAQVKGIYPTISPSNREGYEYILQGGIRNLSPVLNFFGIKHVLVAGFGTDMCVLGRTTGLRRLAIEGYEVTLLRDATQGSIFFEHGDQEKDMTGTSIDLIELNFGYSALSTNLKEALSEIKTPLKRTIIRH